MSEPPAPDDAPAPAVTDAPTLPPPPGAAASPAVRVARGPQLSGLWFVTGPLLIVLVGTLVVVSFLRVPYFAFSPGSARSVEPLISFSGPGTEDLGAEPADDDLLFVTVSVSRDRISGFQAFYGLLAPKVEIVPEVVVIGDSTPEKNSAFNVKLMTDSQDVARKVALERLGYEVVADYQGAVLADLSPDVPAAKVLSPGDTIVGADGEPIRQSDDLKTVISAHEPGDTIRLDVVPLGSEEPTEVDVELTELPDEPGVARMGVSLETRVTYEFPIQVDIDSGKVGGPSAGLAFTLAILDRLTPGSLTGDQKVAVTGTIEPDASVGPVGGVDHKAEAAISAGADLFIVPPDEYEEARETAGSRLEIRQASTLDEALAILQEVGGDPLPAAVDGGTGG